MPLHGAPVQKGWQNLSKMVCSALSDDGRVEARKKEPPFLAAQVKTGRRQTEWTGSHSVSTEWTFSGTKALILKKN
jgi:hypothetical protein